MIIRGMTPHLRGELSLHNLVKSGVTCTKFGNTENKWWRPFKYRTGALLVILEPDPHNIHQEWLVAGTREIVGDTYK